METLKHQIENRIKDNNLQIQALAYTLQNTKKDLEQIEREVAEIAQQQYRTANDSFKVVVSDLIERFKSENKHINFEYKYNASTTLGYLNINIQFPGNNRDHEICISCESDGNDLGMNWYTTRTDNSEHDGIKYISLVGFIASEISKKSNFFEKMCSIFKAGAEKIDLSKEYSKAHELKKYIREIEEMIDKIVIDSYLIPGVSFVINVPRYGRGYGLLTQKNVDARSTTAVTFIKETQVYFIFGVNGETVRVRKDEIISYLKDTTPVLKSNNQNIVLI